MKLLTKDIREKMIANGRAQDAVGGTENEIDFEPVVKIFNPCGAGTWLLTELESDDPDIAFGLCDLGMGCAELGSVRISDLESVRGPFGLGIERDVHWTPKKTLMGYAKEAWEHGRVIA